MSSYKNTISTLTAIPKKYSSISHTHNNYLPISGGTINGTLKVDGNINIYTVDDSNLDELNSDTNVDIRLASGVVGSPGQYYNVRNFSHGNKSRNMQIAWYYGGADKLKYRIQNANNNVWGNWGDIYTTANKPTPAAIGASSTSHNHNKIITSNDGGVYEGNGDDSSSTRANLQIKSWYGIGFSPCISGQTVPQNQNAIWMDVRKGDLTARRNIEAKGNIFASGNISAATASFGKWKEGCVFSDNGLDSIAEGAFNIGEKSRIGYIRCTSVTQMSDINTKEDISYINNDEDDIKGDDFYNFFLNDFKPVSFKYKNTINKNLELGFIAQDIQPTKISKYVLLEKKDKKEGDLLAFNNYSYTSSIAIALQQAIFKIQKLEKEIEILQNK